MLNSKLLSSILGKPLKIYWIIIGILSIMYYIILPVLNLSIIITQNSYIIHNFLTLLLLIGVIGIGFKIIYLDGPIYFKITISLVVTTILCVLLLIHKISFGIDHLVEIEYKSRKSDNTYIAIFETPSPAWSSGSKYYARVYVILWRLVYVTKLEEHEIEINDWIRLNSSTDKSIFKF